MWGQVVPTYHPPKFSTVRINVLALEDVLAVSNRTLGEVPPTYLQIVQDRVNTGDFYTATWGGLRPSIRIRLRYASVSDSDAHGCCADSAQDACRTPTWTA
jgi:hypothetical protein